MAVIENRGTHIQPRAHHVIGGGMIPEHRALLERIDGQFGDKDGSVSVSEIDTFLEANRKGFLGKLRHLIGWELPEVSQAVKEKQTLLDVEVQFRRNASIPG